MHSSPGSPPTGGSVPPDVPLPVDVRRLMVYQILRGLKCIHSARVLHRDLKPQVPGR